MKFNKKGISPLIATVLVIGFTIVLAGVVMQFIMPLFVQSGEKAKADAALMRMCSDFGVSLAIKSAVLSGTDFNVVVDNPTSTDIQDLSMKFYFKDGSAIGCPLKGTVDTATNTVTPIIVANEIKSVKANTECTGLASATLSDITQVEVTPSVWMKDTKEVKTCTSATVSVKV